jgi:ubiquinone/menaquinone biosynthesis C-methylase UbiE
MAHLAAVTAIAVLATLVRVQQRDDAADVARLIDVLQLRPGSVVADIGAGTSAVLTIPIAKHVGPTGKVFATELPNAVFRLRDAVKQSGVHNIEVVEGYSKGTNLPQNCCDAIFIRDSYHHFFEPSAMNASALASLKPGGKLVVLEFAPDGPEASDPYDRAGGSTHGVGAETVARELRQAGFEVLSSEQKPDRSVLVVARRRP